MEIKEEVEIDLDFEVLFEENDTFDTAAAGGCCCCTASTSESKSEENLG